MRSSQSPALVVRGATLLTMASTPIDDGLIVVREGCLDYVGAPRADRVPRDAIVHDAGGAFVTPGLIDAHVHAEEVWELATLLSFGVTTIRNPALASLDSLITLRERCANPARSPSMRLAGPPIDHPPSPWPTSMTVRDEQETRRAVLEQVEAGVDAIKLYAGLPPHLVRAAVQTAHAHNVTVLGDLRTTNWKQATQLGVDCLCHAIPLSPSLLSDVDRRVYADDLRNRRAHPFYRWAELALSSPQAIRDLIEDIAFNGVVVEPTLVMHEAVLRCLDPSFRDEITSELSCLPSALRREHQPADTSRYPKDFAKRAARGWDRILSFVAELHRQDVTVTTGTDAVRRWVAPGLSLHREIHLLAQAGLGGEGALRAATKRAAVSLGMGDRVGTIEQGKEANLVAFSRDPRVAYPMCISWVMHQGVLIDPEELRSMAARAREET